MTSLSTLIKRLEDVVVVVVVVVDDISAHNIIVFARWW